MESLYLSEKVSSRINVEIPCAYLHPSLSISSPISLLILPLSYLLLYTLPLTTPNNPKLSSTY
jgi:hypothetical protein